jgi:hypothetical protein
VLVAQTVGQERSSVVDLAVEACSVRCRAGSPREVGLGEDLEVDLVVGSRVGAFGHHMAVAGAAGAAEVVDMTTGGDA